MSLVSRLKEGGYKTAHFALGFAEEQVASTFGSAPFNIARRHNIYPVNLGQLDWNNPRYRQRQEAEQRGFGTGAILDLGLMVTAFTPMFGDNPRLAKYALTALAVKAVGQVAGFLYNKYLMRKGKI